MEIKVRQEIAKNLAHYRKAKRWTQEELGAKIGVKRNTISSWEKATNAIDVDALFLICQALEISVNDLFGIYANPSTSDTAMQEKSLLYSYRSLPDDGKRVVHAVMDVYTPYGDEQKPK